jgi:hypothetical protein
MPISAARRLIRRARYGKPIVVVSGLPRSGTSMMMQMLEAGGVPPVTDGLRTADESNPKGYFELERVKDLEDASDMAWLRQARGHAVKIIAFLMRHLPETHNYKVIFMHRRLDEILASQTKMLDRLGESTDTHDARMRELFVSHLARTKSLIAHRPCFDVLHVRYNDVIEDGAKHARELNRFLGGGLDTQAMAAVVSPELYRNRR